MVEAIKKESRVLQSTENNQLSKGYTLMELLIIMLILGIIATNALPMLKSSIEESKLSAAASEVTIALEYAQLAAMVSGEQSRVSIDSSADTIVVERFEITGDIIGAGDQMAESDIDAGAFVNMAHPTKRGEDYTIIFADEDRLKDVDIFSAVFGAGNTVTFDAVGAPSDGGTVTLKLGDRQVTLTVNLISGTVTSSN